MLIFLYFFFCFLYLHLPRGKDVCCKATFKDIITIRQMTENKNSVNKYDSEKSNWMGVAYLPWFVCQLASETE